MLRTEGSQEPRGRASLGHTTWRDPEAKLLLQTVRKGDEMAMFFPIGGCLPGMKENTGSLGTHHTPTHTEKVQSANCCDMIERQCGMAISGGVSQVSTDWQEYQMTS